MKIDIDTDSFEKAMEEIKKAQKLVNEALDLVSVANGSVYDANGSRVTIQKLPFTKAVLENSLEKISEILSVGAEYTSDAGNTVLSISNQDVLRLGKGPLNTKLFAQNPNSKLFGEYTNLAYRTSLENFGLNETDIRRVLNGEITVNNLYTEIYNEYCEGNTTRMRALLEAQALSPYYFNIADAEDQIESDSNRGVYLETEDPSINALTKESKFYGKVLANAVLVETANGKRYRTIDSEGNTVYLTETEFQTIISTKTSIDNSIREKNETTSSELQLIRNRIYSNNERISKYPFDFTYTSISQVDTRITELDTLISQATDPGEKLLLQSEKDYLIEIRTSVNNSVEYAIKYYYKPDYKEKNTYNRDGTIYTIKSTIGEQGSSEYLGAVACAIFNGDIELKTIPTPVIGNPSNKKGNLISVDYYGDWFTNDLPMPDNVLDMTISDVVTMSTIENWQKWTPYIKPEEMALFNYICRTESYSAGYQYFEEILAPELDNRYITDQTQRDSTYARSSYIPALFSWIAEPASALHNMNIIFERALAGQKIYKTDSYNSASVWNNQLTQDAFAISPLLGYTLSGTHSMTQSGLVALLTASSGGTMLPALIYSFSIMGSSVFNRTFSEAKEKNIPDSQALLYASLCAITEMAAESYSTTHLLGIESMFENALTDGTVMVKVASKVSKLPTKLQPFATRFLVAGYCFLSQGLVGGEEEAFTSLADNMWDVFVNGNMSEMYQMYNSYRTLHPNCSEVEAYMFVIGQTNREAAEEFIMGGLSEGAMGAFTSLGGMPMAVNLVMNINNKSNIRFEVAGADTISTVPSNDSSSNTTIININPNSEVRTVSDTDVVPRLEMPETLNERNLILVRSTDIFPSNHTIVPLLLAGKGPRPTLHFTLNGLVAAVPQGNDWKGNPFIILEPMKYHIDPSLRGGFAGDTYYNSNFKLSDDAIIMINQKWYDKHSTELPQGYNYIVFNGDTETCVANVLSENGWYVNISTPLPAIKVGLEGATKSQVDFESKYLKYLGKLKSEGMSGIAPGVVHFNSHDMQYEMNMNTIQKCLRITRGNGSTVEGSINPLLGINNVLISDIEFLYLSRRAYTETKDSFIKSMAALGISYDISSDEFSIVDYDSYFIRRYGGDILTGMNPTIPAAEIDAAYNRFLELKEEFSDEKINQFAQDIVSKSGRGYNSIDIDYYGSYSFIKPPSMYNSKVNKITLERPIINQHLYNYNRIGTETAAATYLNAIARSEFLLQHPPQDMTIFEDENYRTFIQSFNFGYEMTLDANTEAYNYKGVSIPKSNMEAFITAIMSTMDRKFIGDITATIRQNPNTINYRIFDYASDSEFSSLYGTLGKSMFTSGFNEIMANSSISDVEDAISSPKMASIKEKLDWFATKGIDIFNSDFVENFSADEISQLGNILTSIIPELDVSYAQTMINSHNYALMHDILEYLDLGYGRLKGKINLLGKNLTNITSIYDGQIISNEAAVRLLLYRLSGKYAYLDSHYPEIIFIKNRWYDSADTLEGLLNSVSSVTSYINENSTLFNGDFKERFGITLKIQELIADFYTNPSSERATQIFNLIGDNNYIDLVSDMLESIYRTISEDYAIQVSQAYDSMKTPVRMVDGVTVHDITNQEFAMLVHVISPKWLRDNLKFDDIIRKWGRISNFNPNISLSLITPNNPNTYHDKTGAVILGFSDISGCNIGYATPLGVGTNMSGSSTRPRLEFKPEHHVPFNILASQQPGSRPNEITINRYDSDGNPLMPTYLVCFGYADSVALNAARVLGNDGNPLPIYVIHSN